MNTLTAEYLREILLYEPETGVFTWKVSPARIVRSGSVAGNICPRGYVSISIFRKRYKAHRLAWLYMTGSFPEKDIDHINRIKSDNSFRNLREVSRAENMQNQNVRGAFYNKLSQTWQSAIGVDGKSIFLGRFDSEQAAHEAYLAAKKIYHPFSVLP